MPLEQPEPLPCQVGVEIQASPAGKVLGSDALGDCGLSHSSVLAIQHALVKGLRSRTSTLLITACISQCFQKTGSLIWKIR